MDSSSDVVITIKSRGESDGDFHQSLVLINLLQYDITPQIDVFKERSKKRADFNSRKNWRSIWYGCFCFIAIWVRVLDSYFNRSFVRFFSYEGGRLLLGKTPEDVFLCTLPVFSWVSEGRERSWRSLSFFEWGLGGSSWRWGRSFFLSILMCCMPLARGLRH